MKQKNENCSVNCLATPPDRKYFGTDIKGGKVYILEFLLQSIYQKYNLKITLIIK